MPIKKKLEIINLGDDLLDHIQDNSYLNGISKELTKSGLSITSNKTNQNDLEKIQKYFLDVWSKNDVIIATGALSTSFYALAREAVSKALDLKLVNKAELDEELKDKLQKSGKKFTEKKRQQVQVFEEAIIFPNPKGITPGQWLVKDGKILIMLPGHSDELREMFIDHVMPKLEVENIAFVNDAYLKIRSCGKNKNEIEKILSPIFEPLSNDLNITYKEHRGVVDIQIGASDSLLGWRDIEKVGEQCREALGIDFIGFGDISPAEVVLKQLRNLNKTFAVAESCTGGLIASAFTDIPGSSKAFMGGLVCYTNDVKISLLGVPEAVIQQHGAVSAECAVAMATAAQETFDVDYALSITGYAGAIGGTDNNPAGTIYIGYSSPVGAWAHRISLPGSRLEARISASMAAIDLMRRKLKKYEIHDLLDCLAC